MLSLLRVVQLHVPRMACAGQPTGVSGEKATVEATHSCHDSQGVAFRMQQPDLSRSASEHAVSRRHVLKATEHHVAFWLPEAVRESKRLSVLHLVQRRIVAELGLHLQQCNLYFLFTSGYAPGTGEWLEDRGTCGVAESDEETPWHGAIAVGARRGFGVNRENSEGEFPTKPVTSEAHPYPSTGLWKYGYVTCEIYTKCGVFLCVYTDCRLVSLARLRPVRGRRTRIKYVIGLTGLAEAFRHS
ncbi:hypothetical protein Taro_051053 [Colocasia esculenta]|uniref:Uncharacterized protein n=1 Tax=Colocasia esculenta TaxID=4460 RepID=A0A843XFZ1_COLES|nr:hypothetical protein [Colocasia esculenta]